MEKQQMPEWAQKLDRRLDALLEAEKPKEKKEPEKKKPTPTPTPKANTDKEVEAWAKGNRDGKIYGY